jgi:hypothetical protein
VKARCDKAGKVRHVDPQIGSNLIGYGAKCCEI